MINAMKKKPIAIVLGGTNPHIALIENLKNRGYHTVLIDYFKNPVAKKAADEFVRESTLDQEFVLRFARKKKADLVITTCLDHANVTACYTAEKLHLPAPYSYKTALNVTNKLLMKQIMVESGIPTSRFITVDNSTLPKTIDLNYPLVVKPSDSNGSKGVRRANDQNELAAYLDDAIKNSRIGNAIIEEFIFGNEFSLDCFIKDKKTHVIMVRKKYNRYENGKSVIHCYASLAPAPIHPKVIEKAKKIVDKITEVFGLDNTSMLVQLMVNKEDVKIIEFAARVSGGMPYKIVKLNTGFDLIDATIDSYLGIEKKIVYSKSRHYYATNNIYASPGYFGYVTGYRELLEKKIIDGFYFYKTQGMSVGDDMAGNNRIGSFIIRADAKRELLAKIKEAFEKINVYDIDGKPIMRKDVYLTKI